jgi:hypothetical protein
MKRAIHNVHTHNVVDKRWRNIVHDDEGDPAGASEVVPSTIEPDKSDRDENHDEVRSHAKKILNVKRHVVGIAIPVQASVSVRGCVGG